MKSLHKALDILETFLEVGSGEIRLSEIAKITGIHKATVNRIASVFVTRGYLNQLERRGKYSLGARFLRFSSIIKHKTKITDLAMPHLVALNKLVKESVALFGCTGEKIYFIEEVHSKYPLRLIPEPDHTIPLYCTGVGKIFLATLTTQKLEKYFKSSDIKSFTPNTITNLDQLKKHLLIVAREGVAYDNEEWYLGVRTVAAGIRDSQEKLVGCIDVTGPTVRLTPEMQKEMAPYVKQYAMKISIDLGYRDNSL